MDDSAEITLGQIAEIGDALTLTSLSSLSLTSVHEPMGLVQAEDVGRSSTFISLSSLDLTFVDAPVRTAVTSKLTPRKLQRRSRGSPEHLSQEPSGCHMLLLDALKAIEHFRQEPSGYLITNGSEITLGQIAEVVDALTLTSLSSLALTSVDAPMELVQAEDVGRSLTFTSLSSLALTFVALQCGQP